MARRGLGSGDEVAREAGVPDDLDASLTGPYTIPTTRRRRVAAVVMVVVAAAVAGGVLAGLPAGMLAGSGLLVLAAAWAWSAAWPLRVTVEEALDAANRHAEFPVGHASAAVGFDGWRAKPIWNVLAFSAEDPPTQRGLVRVDAVSGEVIGSYVEGDSGA